MIGDAPGPVISSLEGIATAAGLHSSALAQLGITRVGDQTDLDVTEIPVWFACRPNSRGLSVAQGKGLTHEQALISAVMESAEGALAERHETLVTHFDTAAAMERRGLRTAPLESMLRCSPDGHRRDVEFAWVAGRSWRSGEPCYAPYELVGFDLSSGASWNLEAFHMSSIGLGAHHRRDRAILHALLEVIENDATASLDIFGFSRRLAHPVLPESGFHPGLERATRLLAGVGLDVHYYEVAGALPLPNIACFLGQEIAGPGGSGKRWNAGFACRPTAHEAALAALLEAVQSRVAVIAGAREDLESADFEASRSEHLSADVAGARPRVVAGRPPATELPSTNIDSLVNALARAGVDDVYVFDLGGDDLGLHVVRVLVPNLQVPAMAGVVRLGGTTIRQLLESPSG